MYMYQVFVPNVKQSTRHAYNQVDFLNPSLFKSQSFLSDIGPISSLFHLRVCDYN